MSDANTKMMADSSPVAQESLIQVLSECESGMDWMLRLVKQDQISAKELSIFLKKRAAIEQDYGRNMMKLAQSMISVETVKVGTQDSAWAQLRQSTADIAANHQNLANSLSEMEEQVCAIHKDTERSRKQIKEGNNKLLKQMTDAEQTSIKSKAKYEHLMTEFDKVRMQNHLYPPKYVQQPINLNHQGSNIDMLQAAARRLSLAVNPFNKPKTEDELSNKTSQAGDLYKQRLENSKQLQQEYYTTHLPHLIKSLKDIDTECSVGLKGVLVRYGKTMEATAHSELQFIESGHDGNSPRLTDVFQSIDHEKDFEESFGLFMQITSKSRRQNNAAYQQRNSLSSTPMMFDNGSRTFNNTQPLSSTTHPTFSAGEHVTSVTGGSFGVDLEQLVAKEKSPVPQLVLKCVEAIEEYGITTPGIYRTQGSQGNVQKLRNQFDSDARKVNLHQPEQRKYDIQDVATVLKMFLKDLPEPVFNHKFYSQLIEASKLASAQKRMLAVHEIINELPDAHYIILKFLMSHFSRVAGHSTVNQMASSNLGSVFGPILVREGYGDGADSLKDLPYRSEVVKTVIDHYREIFEFEE